MWGGIQGKTATGGTLIDENVWRDSWGFVRKLLRIVKIQGHLGFDNRANSFM